MIMPEDDFLQLKQTADEHEEKQEKEKQKAVAEALREQQEIQAAAATHTRLIVWGSDTMRGDTVVIYSHDTEEAWYANIALQSLNSRTGYCALFRNIKAGLYNVHHTW